MTRGDILKYGEVIVEVLTAKNVEGATPFPEKRADQGMEKHVPVVEKNDKEVIVRVGDTPHPMEAAHWIEWVELRTPTKSYKVFLSPGEEPIARFPLLDEEFVARAYCNLHGLWKNA